MNIEPAISEVEFELYEKLNRLNDELEEAAKDFEENLDSKFSDETADIAFNLASKYLAWKRAVSSLAEIQARKVWVWDSRDGTWSSADSLEEE